MQRANRRPAPDIRAIARLIPPDGNLVQGQNEVPIHRSLVSAINNAIEEGFNHYSFFEGVNDLREAVAQKVKTFNGVTVDPAKKPLELIITPGATGGLVTIAHSFLRGSSAIVFEPYYPYHKRTLATCDARVDIVRLKGSRLELDIDDLRQACRKGVRRTSYPLKAIIVCSPANPTGRVFTREELQSILDCADHFNLVLISDEVYEHFTLDPLDHVSLASLPGAFERTITVNSFSKSWAVSGWRLGYVYGPGKLVDPLATLGNVYYVCTPTPFQHALATVLLADLGYYEKLRTAFARKRELFNKALIRAGFEVYDSRSAFYTWARIPPGFSDAMELNEFLIRNSGVAGVPGSAFMDDPDEDLYLRLCFAREDSMLESVGERIVRAMAIYPRRKFRGRV